MGDRHDYVALEWVKGEIAETLKQARQALEAFVENPQDATRMRFCQTYVHQVLGTLQMVEFYGAALLAEEMEQLTSALIDGRVGNLGEALEVLMQAILQLPIYLDRIQTARRDLPMVVLPLLNDLRSARGEKLLSETSLFAPDMSARTPALNHETIASLSTAELPVLLRKLRQMLQMALVGVIRNQDVPTNLGYMARVLARLENLCAGAPLGALWPIAAGVVEGLADGSVSNTSSVRTLLRQVDKELKRLLDQGAEGFNQAAPEDLSKNLLFYIAKSSSQSPRIQHLKAQYRLEDALPESHVVDEERARLAGPDRDAMRSVVTALCEELVRVKDSLDLFVRSDRSQVNELQQLAAPLKQIADTLAVLGFAQPRKVIGEQLEVVSNLAKGLGEPTDAVLMDVAGALLYVEATLAGMVGPTQDASEDNHLPTTDVAQIHQVVIKEARTGLEQAKDSIIEFIASQWNHEHLARVPELLTQARGGLAMIPLPRAAELLSACTRYIQDQLLARKAVPNWQSLDMLADAITSVEYYLERLSEDHGSQGDLILDVAEESLANLGYPLHRAEPEVDAAPASAEAESPAPLALEESEQVSELAEPVIDFSNELTFDEEALPSSDTPAELGFSLADELGVALEPSTDAEATLPELELVDFDFAELETGPEVEVQPLLESLPELVLEDEAVAFDSLELSGESVEWDDAEIAALELPEVELPSAPVLVEPEVVFEKPLTMADVMATPVQAINPPAVDAPPSLLPPPADEEPFDEDLLEVFIEEVGEVLETIGEYFPQWCADSDNKEALTEVRRAFHTLKGSGRMVRALIIGELAWSVENLLNRVLDRTIEPSVDVQQVIADVVGLMPELLNEFANKAQRQRDDVDALAATAHALAKGQKPVLSVADEHPAEQPDQVAAVASPQGEQPLDVIVDAEFDPQLLEIFRNEAQMHLDTLVAFLADCAQELPQPVTDDLQRSLHTLKGSASMAGISPVAEIAAPLERLVKELKTNLIAVDLAEAELLSDAEKLIRQGIDQLATQPLAALSGATEFLARVQQLHSERLEQAEISRQGDQGSKRDPQMISIFLAEGMDILLDAEDLLRRWREHPTQRQELSSLLDELTTLGRGAEMAELPQIEELCEALLDLYGAVEEGSLAVSEPFFNEVEQAHETLISMMDQVAAALDVSPTPERVAALRDLLSQAVPPDAIGLLSDDGLSMQVLELPDELSPIAPAEVFPVDELDLPELDVSTDVAAAPSVDDAAFVPEPTEVLADAAHATDSNTALDMLDEEMVAIFLEEAVDILESAGQALERWLADLDNKPALSSLQRDLHTLKGGARMAEIRPIGDLAHELESLYEGLVDGRYSYSPALSGLLQQSHDCLAQQLEQLQARAAMPQPEALIEAIQNFRLHGFAAEPVDALAAIADEVADVVEFVDAPETLAESEAITVEDLPEVGEADGELAIEAADSVQAEVVSDTPQPVADEHVEVLSDARIESAEPVPPLHAVADEVDDRDPELVEIFLEEGFDIIDSAAAALQRWTQDVDNSVELEALQRDLHTLKGGARMAEVREIGDLAHELEFLYEGLGQGLLKADQGLFTLLQTCHDSLFGMLEAVRDHKPVPSGDVLIETVKNFRSNPGQQLSMPSAVTLKASDAAPNDEAEADILDIFLEEADDLLEAMDVSLSRQKTERDCGNSIDDLLRILHTLKGGARLAGQARLGDLTHELEQHLSDAQSHGVLWNDSLLADTQSGIEGLRNELDVLRQRLQDNAHTAPTPVSAAGVASETPDALPQLAAPIIAASQGQNEQVEIKVLPFVRKAQEAALESAARRAPQELVRVPAELLEGLVNLAGETSIFRGRVEQQVSDFAFTLNEMEATIDRVRDQLRRLDTETQAQILSSIQAEAERAGYEDFDPLEMDRHSQLQQLSRSLFESASDLLDLKETLAARSRDAETLLLQQARVNSELQEGLMRTRMVPFDRLVPRLRRIVRQVSTELGKQVEFHIGNAEGEMDRTVLERIVAPLEHMLRNAVDHGVEAVDVRRTAGKPEHGTIRLDLGREGGDIVLTLSDDGAGIRLEAVRQKAIQRGLMQADADLSEQEILQFILEAGFTTTEKVTQISGRGVGMDVANSEVKQLGGSMSIESKLGSGTTFTVRLPFTVSVNRALMVLSGEDLYAIPLNTIEGIVRVSPYELEAYYAPDAPRFEYAGQAYELRYLGDLLNNGQHPKLVGQSLPLPVILVRSKEHVVAVQVDSLAGSREIVVKSLGPQFAGVHGISGATILGDGRVVVILDLLATIRAQHAHLLTLQPRQQRLANLAAESEAGRPVLVMVVDDSVTVRKVTTRLLERNGMNVLTAKDGVDAIAQLQERKPDIMLLDIEMPRMDGFEVATLVRHDENLKDLPIIMITSRTGDKHRERAMSLGVNEYLGKPYQEALLLETIQGLVKQP